MMHNHSSTLSQGSSVHTTTSIDKSIGCGDLFRSPGKGEFSTTYYLTVDELNKKHGCGRSGQVLRSPGKFTLCVI